METVIISRHPALVRRILHLHLAPKGTPVLTGTVTADDVAGRHVIGVLPLSLAAHADRVTEIPINWRHPAAPPRGTELDDDALNQMAGDPITYQVVIL